MNRQKALLEIKEKEEQSNALFNQIEKLENKHDRLIDEIRELEKSIVIHINHKSVGSGGRDEHYKHTVSLNIKDYTISYTSWDNWKILNLSEKNIIDIVDNIKFYSCDELKRYCTNDSFDRLIAYIKFKY